MQMWTRNKRALSESDCEDLYQDDHSKEYVFIFYTESAIQQLLTVFPFDNLAVPHLARV